MEYLCDECGHEVDELVYAPNGDMCEDCADRLYYRCADCGDFCEADYSNGNGEIVCYDCSCNYVSCEECGDIIHVDHAYSTGWGYVCEYCKSNESQYIHGYHSHGIGTKFLNPKGTLGIGAELELDIFDTEDVAEQCYAGEDLEFFEEDSSVEGFETVTHVMSLSQHKDWIRNRVGANLIELADSSQEVDTGLHVNVSEDDYFTKGVIHYFVNRHADQFKKLGRRYVSTYAEFTKPKYDSDSGKFYAVNTGKRGCVEFRFFHTTTSADVYIGSLEISHAIVKYVQSLVRVGTGWAQRQVEKASFDDFVKFVKKQGYEVADKYMEVYLSQPIPCNMEAIGDLL